MLPVNILLGMVSLNHLLVESLLKAIPYELYVGPCIQQVVDLIGQLQVIQVDVALQEKKRQCILL